MEEEEEDGFLEIKGRIVQISVFVVGLQEVWWTSGEHLQRKFDFVYASS